MPCMCDLSSWEGSAIYGWLWESYDFGSLLLAVTRFKCYSLISIGHRIGTSTFRVAVIIGGMVGTQGKDGRRRRRDVSEKRPRFVRQWGNFSSQ